VKKEQKLKSYRSDVQEGCNNFGTSG